MHKKTKKRKRYGPFARWAGRVVLRLCGWRFEGCNPGVNKCVILGVPHTSNWDLFFMFFGSLAMELPGVFIMKASVFWWPLGVFWRWCGGIPVNRRAAGTFVEKMIDVFEESDFLYLVITPEGTRKKVEHWKLGFYWIAEGAGASILPAYINYKEKKVGVGPLVYTQDGIEAAFEQLRAFYQEKVGLSPQYNPRQAERARFIKKSAAARRAADSDTADAVKP